MAATAVANRREPFRPAAGGVDWAGAGHVVATLAGSRTRGGPLCHGWGLGHRDPGLPLAGSVPGVPPLSVVIPKRRLSASCGIVRAGPPLGRLRPPSCASTRPPWSARSVHSVGAREARRRSPGARRARAVGAAAIDYCASGPSLGYLDVGVRVLACSRTAQGITAEGCAYPASLFWLGVCLARDGSGRTLVSCCTGCAQRHTSFERGVARRVPARLAGASGSDRLGLRPSRVLRPPG